MSERGLSLAYISFWPTYVRFNQTQELSLISKVNWSGVDLSLDYASYFKTNALIDTDYPNETCPLSHTYQ